MYMQFVINLWFLFWSLFLQLSSPLAKLVTWRPAPSPSRSFGEPADTCWGSSQPPLQGFYLHAPFLADRFQISQRGAFQPTDCSSGLWHLRHRPAPRPLCVGTDLRVLAGAAPLGLPSHRTKAAPDRAEVEVCSWAGSCWVGVMAAFHPQERQVSLSCYPHTCLKAQEPTPKTRPTCKAQGGGSSGSGNVGTLRSDAPKEQSHGGVSGSSPLCYAGMGPLHTPPREALLLGC